MSNTKIYLEQGAAWKIVNGKRVGVTSINAPAGDDCCQFDCCNGTITYKSPGNGGALTTISLDAIAALLGVVPNSSSNAPSSSNIPASSSNVPPSSSGPAASSSGA